MIVFNLFEPHVILTFVGAAIVLNLTPGVDVAFTMAYGLLAGSLSDRIHRYNGPFNTLKALSFGGLAARLARQ